MQFSITLLASFVFVALASADQIEFCSDQSCGGDGGSCTYQSPGAPSGCIQLGGIGSAKALSSGAGCHFELYATDNCLDGVDASIDTCYEDSGGILSYSYTC